MINAYRIDEDNKFSFKMLINSNELSNSSENVVV